MTTGRSFVARNVTFRTVAFSASSCELAIVSRPLKTLDAFAASTLSRSWVKTFTPTSNDASTPSSAFNPRRPASQVCANWN